MEFGYTLPSQCTSPKHREKVIWRKSLVSVLLEHPGIHHSMGIIFSGDQEMWYDGLASNPSKLQIIETPRFFGQLEEMNQHFFEDITLIRVPPSYSENALTERNYGHGALHLATMKLYKSPTKFAVVVAAKDKVMFDPADFSDRLGRGVGELAAGFVGVAVTV